jgi:hypothetical protein
MGYCKAGRTPDKVNAQGLRQAGARVTRKAAGHGNGRQSGRDTAGGRQAGQLITAARQAAGLNGRQRGRQAGKRQTAAVM